VLTVTLSIGGSLARAQDSAASLLQRADRLMYASKINGRDRVTIQDR
jgi:GGDEF domain-containing protein